MSKIAIDDKARLIISALIIPADYEFFFDPSLNFPIISVKLKDFEELKKYDFRQEMENYFVYISCK